MKIPFIFLPLFVLTMILIGCTNLDIPKSIQLEQKTESTLHSYAEKVAKEHNLELLGIGTSSVLDIPVYSGGFWTVNLISRDKHSLAEGRALAEKLGQIFYQHIASEPIYTQASVAAHTSSGNRFPDEISLKHIGIKLSYWDERYDRPTKPYLAQIRLIEDNLYFYYANPDSQELTDPEIQEIWENNKRPWQEL